MYQKHSFYLYYSGGEISVQLISSFFKILYTQNVSFFIYFQLLFGILPMQTSHLYTGLSNPFDFSLTIHSQIKASNLVSRSNLLNLW